MNNNLIKNIVITLVIVCCFFSCKKEQNASKTEVLQVGQEFGGGVIFYIDASGKHGLVAAQQDAEAKVKWGQRGVKTHASLLEVGGGSVNTALIVDTLGVDNYAASVCRQLTINGYADWFLPSKSELNLLYQKRDLIGGFSTDYYWSSSEQDSLSAWYLYFPYGPQYHMDKDTAARVRAVREF